MLNRISKAVAGVLVVAGLGWAQSPAAPAADPAKARADYDAYAAISKETDPVKRLAMLDDWTQKSPDTTYKTQRNYLYIDSYSRIGAAVLGGTPTVDQLAAAEKADHTVIDKADTLFSADMKPVNAQGTPITDAQWAQAKSAVLLAANQSLAAIYLARKDYPSLEKQDAKLIEMNPGDAKATLQMGTAIYLGGKVERHPEAFYQYARAVSITGPGALDPATKKSTDDYLTRAYKGYHGDTKGLDDMKAMAAKSPMPPSDFHVESVTDISKKEIANEEEFNKSHPEIIEWRNVKAALNAPEGETYFNKQMKGAAFPKTKGKVVAQSGPKEVTVSVDNATPETAARPEVTLKFTDATIKTAPTPGTDVTFTDAEPISYTKDPYMIVFDVEKANVEGLDLAPAGAAKKAPVRRKKTK